MPKVILTYA